MNEQQIKNELSKFNLADEAIREMGVISQSLVILGIEDKAGFDAVENLRKDVKARRVQVETTRKALNEDALAWQRAVNAEAKRITALLEPIEADLTSKANWFKTEKERIKKEKEEAERRFIQDRKDRIFKAGGTFNGQTYGLGFLAMSEEELKADTEEHFENFVGLIQEQTDKRRAEEAELARLRQAEADRLAKEQEERRLAQEQAQAVQETPVATPTPTPVQEVQAKPETPVATPVQEATPKANGNTFQSAGQSLFQKKTPEEVDNEALWAFSQRLLNSIVPPMQTEKARGIMDHAKRRLVDLGQEIQRMI